MYEYRYLQNGHLDVTEEVLSGAALPVSERFHPAELTKVLTVPGRKILISCYEG